MSLFRCKRCKILFGHYCEGPQMINQLSMDAHIKAWNWLDAHLEPKFRFDIDIDDIIAMEEAVITEVL